MRIDLARHFFIVAILLFAESQAQLSAYADYIVNLGPYRKVRRVTDSGATVRLYSPPPGSDYEFDAHDYAVTPDFSTVYDFPFTQGFSDLVYAFDVTTGQPKPDNFLNPDATINPDQNFTYRTRQALISPNVTSPAGDLYVISGADQSPLNVDSSNDVIKRFTRTPTSYLGNPHVETILPPYKEQIYDFAFGPDSGLYISSASGVFRYSPNSPTLHSYPQSQNWEMILENTSGMIAFGPDGRLYVRDRITGNVERYTATGEFVNTFISNAHIPGSGHWQMESIQVGADGNFHLATHYIVEGVFPISFPGIAKYDGVTGAFLSMTTMPANLSIAGRVTYMPVPEPSSILLLLAAAVFCRPPRTC